MKKILYITLSLLIIVGITTSCDSSKDDPTKMDIAFDFLTKMFNGPNEVTLEFIDITSAEDAMVTTESANNMFKENLDGLVSSEWFSREDNIFLGSNYMIFQTSGYAYSITTSLGEIEISEDYSFSAEIDFVDDQTKQSTIQTVKGKLIFSDDNLISDVTIEGDTESLFRIYLSE